VPCPIRDHQDPGVCSTERMPWHYAQQEVGRGRRSSLWVDGIGPALEFHRAHPQVLGGLGGLRWLCACEPGLSNPLLVGPAHGVGHQSCKKKKNWGFPRRGGGGGPPPFWGGPGAHHDVGIESVAMCGNDVDHQLAPSSPSFSITSPPASSGPEACPQCEGIADGCRQKRCRPCSELETAEMPASYAPGRTTCRLLVAGGSDALIDGKAGGGR